MPHLLVVDLGGSALRATVVDSDGGNVVGRGQRTVAQVVDAPPLGRSWDATVLWDATCAAIREALYRAGGEPVAAVAATGQRIGCVALSEGGAVLYAGPNLDTRGAATGWVVAEAAGDELYARTGRSLAMLYAPARMAWLRQERPEVFERVARVLGVGDWLALKLCGEVATEPSTATDLLALDVRSGEYWRELWSRSGLDPAWLPPLRRAGDCLGEVTEDAARSTGIRAGTPVAVTAADSGAAMLGAGAAHPGTTLALAGTTLPVLATTDAVTEEPDGIVWFGRHSVQPRGVVESNGGTAGYGWAWCVERLVGGLAQVGGDAVYALAERMAASAPPAAHDALLFSGGPAILDATTPATFLARQHALVWPTEVLQPDLGAADVVRAALEGVAHSVRANVEQVEKVAGRKGQRLVLAGGMSRNGLLLRIVAALLDREVNAPAVRDATVTGAAACAAVAAGHHPDLDAASAALTHVDVVATPDPAWVPVYAEAHRAWRGLYVRLKSL